MDSRRHSKVVVPTVGCAVAVAAVEELATNKSEVAETDAVAAAAALAAAAEVAAAREAAAATAVAVANQSVAVEQLAASSLHGTLFEETMD